MMGSRRAFSKSRADFKPPEVFLSFRSRGEGASIDFDSKLALPTKVLGTEIYDIDRGLVKKIDKTSVVVGELIAPFN